MSDKTQQNKELLLEFMKYMYKDLWQRAKPRISKKINDFLDQKT